MLTATREPPPEPIYTFLPSLRLTRALWCAFRHAPLVQRLAALFGIEAVEPLAHGDCPSKGGTAVGLDAGEFPLALRRCPLPARGASLLLVGGGLGKRR